ncbi:MFS general substrate transporter [Karstenula rhodostoma CBS 690.94]|uniref:MFS general substrate transporter n=1 Tax=Karstenula rhodostoma CBS 690.94 TaxID=1392251 RepID=A0A9P4PJA7_9PLEO|nr:MFS general substrate transporter [Karstenula rhodostoma CBS 690.94]
MPVSDEERTAGESKPPQQVTKIRAPPNRNLVDWEGENDPSNPLNWPSWTKTVNITIILMMCVTHASAATAFIPSIGSIQEDFESDNAYLSAFIVSAYPLGFTAGPLLIVPLAEILGRVLLYHLCNLLFVSFTCWCAVTKSLGMLALARCLAGCGGAVTVSLAAGSMSDMVQGNMSRLLLIVVGLAIYLTPAISPLVGSHIYFKWGWPWIFWISAIMGGICTVIGFALSETYEPILLINEATEWRRRTQNWMLFTPFDEHPNRIITTRCRNAFRQPLRILLSPSFLLTSFLPAAGFAFLYIVYITLPRAFLSVYTWPSMDLGLAYLGIAVGIIIAVASGAAASEKYAKLRAARNDTRAENRLIPLLCFWPLTGLGLFLYGYCVHQKMHWAGPVVSLGLVGAGVMFSIQLNSLYLFDAFPTKSTSAIHASLLLQSLLGGVIPLFSHKLYEYFSSPYMFYFLGGIALPLTIVPGIFYLLRRGEGPAWAGNPRGECSARTACGSPSLPS